MADDGKKKGQKRPPKGVYPEQLKGHGFKKGNQAAKGLTNSGRPRDVIKRPADLADLNSFRKVINKRAEWDKVVETIYYNAFEKKNSNGSFGNVTWARLFLAYAIGQPPVKVESTHTNTVDMLRMMVEQQLQAQEPEPVEADYTIVSNEND